MGKDNMYLYKEHDNKLIGEKANGTGVMEVGNKGIKTEIVGKDKRESEGEGEGMRGKDRKEEEQNKSERESLRANRESVKKRNREEEGGRGGERGGGEEGGGKG